MKLTLRQGDRIQGFSARRRPIGSALLLALLCLMVAGPAAAQDAPQVAERVRARYADMQAMHARFVQTITSDYMDAEQRYSGTVLFEGDRYRIETGSQTIVTDGVTTWVYNQPENQVLLSDYVEDETAFSLTQFLQRFDEDYDFVYGGSETIEGVQSDMLDMTPRNEQAPFRAVRLWVRRTDGVVPRLRVVDLNDMEMVFELSQISFDPSVDAESFQFEPPEGVEVIDLRG